MRSRDDGLERAVVVHGPSVARLGGKALDGLGVELHDGAHGAGVLGGGVGHELGAVAHELKALLVGVGAGKGERGHLAEREARHHVRRHAARGERTGAREVGGKDAGLRVDGLRQLLLGAGEALLGGAGAHGVRRVKDGARRRLGLDEVRAHAGVLGALAGEEEGYFTHCIAPARTFSAPFTRSSTISSALCRSLTMPAI